MNFNYFLSSYKKKNGTQLLRLKLETSQSDVQYLDSGISVQKNQWDGKRKKIKRHPLEDKLNSNLTSLLVSVQKLYYDNTGVSAKRLLFLYKNNKKYDSSSFLDFYQQIVDEARLKGKIRTANTQDKYIKKLKKFASHISFSDLSVQFAKDYEKWMLEKGNKVNTVASNFKAIYSVLNKAVKIGVINHNPIKGFEITTENTPKDSLTFEEITKLSELEIPSRFKGMAKARDLFLFSFYTAGMRFSDVCRLKWQNIVGNEIVYTMHKSRARAGAKRTLPLTPKSIAILDKYRGNDDIFIFPPLYGMNKKGLEEIEHKLYIANNAANRSLRIVCEKAGIKKWVNMHMAKHSFADFAVKNNTGLLMISKLLGHTKLSTTQHYLKDFYHKEESEEMNRLFG
ncbi:tyrosine-type recombinase/integrase [Maribacter sp. ACAM166]|uniref:tyrosine-type recombinase/integrase n=1 Tax=Maribacter sp. ACAM166 TaxID=2508996 RepID=UPI0010FE25F1|nr:phage integrase SAM-like domain-containing protein [Maribacter sp. ACAM166]TLP81856.1 site-specific integrase [Maribacter sp. ACAM166]